MRYIYIFLLISYLILTACATPVTRVNTTDDRGPEGMGLDYRDFEIGATEAVQKMLRSGAVNHPNGGRYVLAVSRITNDTMQHISTTQLTKKIRIELLNSGKVVTTTAIGLDEPEDEMSSAVRELRQSDEVHQSRLPGKGQLQSPDLSLSGRLIQQTQRMNRKTQRTEYYLQLTLTEVGSGLAIWEGETMIVKQGSARSVSW